MKIVDHILSLIGFPGGVQVSFRSYYEKVRHAPTVHHRVFGTHPLSPEYETVDRYRNLRDSWSAKAMFVRDLMSSDAVVHFYNYLCNASVSRLLTLVPSNRIVMHERGASWNFDVSHRDCARCNADRADVVLTNSKASRILITEKWGIPRERVEVVYNGVITDQMMDMALPTGNGSAEFIVGYLGRLDSPKGVFTLIDAAAELSAHPNIKYRIVGDGVLRDELERYARDRDVAGRVRFMGSVHNPYGAISEFDVLVVPSIREPLGNVAIEAGVVGTPVIAASVDGLPEVVGDGGILLSPSRPLRPLQTEEAVSYPDVVVDPQTQSLVSPMELDPKELAAAVLNLYEDPDRKAALGRRLAERVRNLFSVASYARQLDDVYERLLGA